MDATLTRSSYMQLVWTKSAVGLMWKDLAIRRMFLWVPPRVEMHLFVAIVGDFPNTSLRKYFTAPVPQLSPQAVLVQLGAI